MINTVVIYSSWEHVTDYLEIEWNWMAAAWGRYHSGKEKHRHGPWMDTNNWGLEVNPHGWPPFRFQIFAGTVHRFPPLCSNCRCLFLFQSRSNKCSRQWSCKCSTLIPFYVIVVSIQPPCRMIYIPITLLKGWIPLEHERIGTGCSEDCGVQDFFSDWTQSSRVKLG